MATPHPCGSLVLGVALGAALCVATCAVLALLAAYAGGRAALRGAPPRAPFFTGSASEEPTRSYVPYTGTVPFGLWGALPWAEAVPPP